MDQREVQRGIRESWAAVLEIDMGETISSIAPLRVNEEFRNLLFSDEVQYNELYLAGLECKHYNILLSDFSFFQYSIIADDHVRYAFYPNPFLDPIEAEVNIERCRELLDAGMITNEEFLTLINEQRSDNRAAPIRYESAPRDRREFSHPSSHFHIGHGAGGRWAIARNLTPLAFTLLILKHYYPQKWQAADDPLKETGNAFEAQLIRARAECPEVPEVLFSDLERSCFHFN